MVFTSPSPSVDEILKDQVYLGNLSAAESDETKEKLGITHILSVCREYSSTGANHLSIPVHDSEYDNLLIHLPDACQFIENALCHGGRVLVHCVMGVSRSTTALAAYLMKTKALTTSAAISLIKQRRPVVQPNYGFVKQLETFSECGCEPTPLHPAYRAWRRKQKQDVTNFLNMLTDTTVIIPDQLLLSSDFPCEPDQAELLLIDLGVTHLLSLSPATKITAPVQHRRDIDVVGRSADELLLVLPEACEFIQQATEAGGKVLVHSTLETRACTVVAAYLMFSRELSARAGSDLVRDALPLFDPPSNFTRDLMLFEACKYKPARNHPAITTHCGPAFVSWGSGPESASVQVNNTTSAAASIMSEAIIDRGAFGDTLVVVQQKVGMAPAS